MIEKELTMLMEAERGCAALLEQARQEGEGLLAAARQQARALEEGMVQAAHEQGQALLQKAREREAQRAAAELAAFREMTKGLKARAAARVDAAAQTIFEGMWSDGDR